MTFPPDDQLPIFVFGVKAEVPPSAEESSDFDLGAKKEKKKKKDKEVVAEVEAEAEADFDFGAAKKKKKKDKEVVAEEPPAEASAEAADFDFGAPPLTHIASPSGTACAKGAGALKWSDTDVCIVGYEDPSTELWQGCVAQILGATDAVLCFERSAYPRRCGEEEEEEAEGGGGQGGGGGRCRV